MPIYEYRCPVGPHPIDHVHRFSDGDRPETVRCVEHGADAAYTISLPAIGVVAGSTNPVRPVKEWTDAEREDKSRGLDLGSFDYRCEACARTFTDLVDFRAGETHKTAKPCPTCGAACVQTFTSAHVDGTIKMYPYYDKGLDCEVTSAQHRRDICKERGLVAVEGDYDAERMYADATRESRNDEIAYAKLVKDRWDDPEMRAWRDDYKARTGRDAIPFTVP